MPVDYLPTMQPTEDADGATPAAIREMRERAKLLLQQRSRVPIYTWANGLDDASAKIFGGLETRRANELEQQGQQSAARDLLKVIPGYGMLGNNPPSAAPGGAANTNPFTRTDTGDDDVDVADRRTPASIRNSNPGAMWPGPSAARFDATGVQSLPGGQKIATFPDAESGAAAQFDLLDRKYSGKTLNSAIREWSGGHDSDQYVAYLEKQTGLSGDDVLTPDLLRSPAGVKLASAMARHEAGRDYPLTDEQWERAQRRAYAPEAAPQGGGQYPALFQDVGKLTNGQTGPQGAQAQPPIRTAQNAPAGTTGAQGMPTPLTSPMLQMNQQDVQRILANPYIPAAQKQYLLQQMLTRSQVQSIPVEGGTLQYDATGRRQFIPEPRFGKRKVGDIEYDTVHRFDPRTGTWNEVPMGRQGPGPVGGSPPPGNAPPVGAPVPPPGTRPPVPTPGAAPSAPGQASTSNGPPPPANEPPPPTAAAPAPAFPMNGTIEQQQEWLDDRKARLKAAETAATEQTKKDTDYYNAVATGTKGQRTVASAQKVNINSLRDYAQDPHLVTGPPGDLMLRMQRTANALGIGDKTKSASTPREMLNMLAAKVLADQFAGIKTLSTQEGEKGARIFKPMLDIEEQANITPNDSIPGILSKLDFIDQLGDHQIRWGNAVNAYEKKHGKIGPEFEEWLMNDIAKTRITPKEVKEPYWVEPKRGAQSNPGAYEPLPAPGGPRSQAEAVGVAPGGTPQRGVTELTGPPRGATPPPRGPNNNQPQRGVYMDAQGRLVLPNDAVGNPEKYLEYTAPLVAGGYGLRYGVPMAKSALQSVGGGKDLGWILKLLGGEIAAKKAGLL